MKFPSGERVGAKSLDELFTGAPRFFGGSDTEKPLMSSGIALRTVATRMDDIMMVPPVITIGILRPEFREKPFSRDPCAAVAQNILLAILS